MAKIQKSNIQEIHSFIYKYMKKTAHSLEGPLSKDLINYRKNQKAMAKRNFSPSNYEELILSIERSHVVYIGDFHTFDQSSKNLERLLRTLENAPYKIAIGVEVVHTQYQDVVDQYLNNYITELEFLEMIDYHDSWRFPWKHYKSFFDLAKRKHLDILALNSAGSLKERDQHAGNLITEYQKQSPDVLLIVLFGEYHITPNKLPKFVKKNFDKNFKHTIIHQNLDEVYFSKDFNQNGTRVGETIKFNESEFSLQTSPPWIKYESMIYWYENLCEDPEFEIHEYIGESGGLGLNSSVPDNLLFICSKTLGAFNLSLPKTALENFNIYDYQKLDFLYKNIESLPQKLTTFYQGLVKNGRIFRLPNTTNFYCSNYSLNRISFLAGIHIFNLILLEKNCDYEKQLFTKGKKPTIFLFFLYQAMSAYFSSKMINPYRKCELYTDLKALSLLKKSQTGTQKEIMLALDIIDFPHNLELHLKSVNLTASFNSSRLVAYFLADIIFDKFLSKKNNNFNSILDIIFSGYFEKDEFLKLMKIVLPDLSYKKSKKRFF